MLEKTRVQNIIISAWMINFEKETAIYYALYTPSSPFFGCCFSTCCRFVSYIPLGKEELKGLDIIFLFWVKTGNFPNSVYDYSLNNNS